MIGEVSILTPVLTVVVLLKRRQCNSHLSQEIPPGTGVRRTGGTQAAQPLGTSVNSAFCSNDFHQALIVRHRLMFLLDSGVLKFEDGVCI